MLAPACRCAIDGMILHDIAEVPWTASCVACSANRISDFSPGTIFSERGDWRRGLPRCPRCRSATSCLGRRIACSKFATCVGARASPCAFHTTVSATVLFTVPSAHQQSPVCIHHRVKCRSHMKSRQAHADALARPFLRPSSTPRPPVFSQQLLESPAEGVPLCICPPGPRGREISRRGS